MLPFNIFRRDHSSCLRKLTFIFSLALGLISCGESGECFPSREHAKSAQGIFQQYRKAGVGADDYMHQISKEAVECKPIVWEVVMWPEESPTVVEISTGDLQSKSGQTTAYYGFLILDNPSPESTSALRHVNEIAKKSFRQIELQFPLPAARDERNLHLEVAGHPVEVEFITNEYGEFKIYNSDDSDQQNHLASVRFYLGYVFCEKT